MRYYPWKGKKLKRYDLNPRMNEVLAGIKANVVNFIYIADPIVKLRHQA